MATGGASAGATVAGGESQQADPAAPAAWILVDGRSGEVLDGANVHEPRPAAGATSLLTALVTVQRLPITSPDDLSERNSIRVSRDAVLAPQPRLGVGQGSAYEVQRMLNGILLTDSNDAAWALAETASGNVPAFAGEMNAFGRRLGLRDSTWTDPMGDDDNTNTPNVTSAWDLALVARAALRVPELRSILRDPEETINGPQLGKRVVNDNDLVHRYSGATGLKQSGSDKAGAVLVGSAEREGRSLIVVELGMTGDPISFAIQKFDAAFASTAEADSDEDPVRPARIPSAQARLEALVNLPLTLGRPALTPGATGSQAPPTPSTAPPPTTTPASDPERADDDGGGGGLFTLTNVVIAVLFAGLVAVVVLRRRAIVVKQRQRISRQRTLSEARRRGTIDFVDPDQVPGTGHVRILRPGERDRRER